MQRIGCVFLFCVTLATAQEWPRFRGPNGSGVSDSTGLPVEFSPAKNVAWKIAVPFARSSPVISGERIFLTASEGDKLLTLCYDRKTGRLLWRREIVRTRITSKLKENDPASPSPTVDRTAVYAFFADFGLVSYDFSGKERWRLPLGPFDTFYGLGTSPAVSGDTLFLVCDTRDKAFLIAVDTNSGRARWRVERPEIHSEGYTSPAIFGDQVVIVGPHHVDAYAVSNGERIWWLRGIASFPIPSPLVNQDELIVSTFGDDGPAPSFDDLLKKLDKNGDGRISEEEAKPDPDFGPYFGGLDRNKDGFLDRAEWDNIQKDSQGDYGLIAIHPQGRGDLTAKGYVWRETKQYSNTSTPVLYQGVLYLVKGGGVLASLDPQTGKTFKVERAKEALDEESASPVAADGKVYFLNQAGKVIVLKAAPQWEVLGVNDLGEECYATPAIADGRIYVRTKSTLYAFQAK
jgi:outer membrane protein assembly factor BamB